MKVLQIVGSYPNGTQPYILWQIKAAMERGHSVSVLAAHTGNESGYALAAQLGLTDVPCRYLNYRTTVPWPVDWMWFTRQIADAANRKRFGRKLSLQRRTFFSKLVCDHWVCGTDLIQIHFVNWAIEVGLPLAGLLNRPSVVTVHAGVVGTRVDLLREVHRQADSVIMVSDGDRRDWVQATGSDAKLTRVWNGLPLPAVPCGDKPDGEGFQIVSVGRLSPEKRHSDTVRAVYLLRQNSVAATLAIFGEGQCREELQNLIHTLGLDEFVTLEGVRAHREVLKALECSDILVHASEQEPFGLALIEGMAVRLPVVAAESNGAREIVEHDVTGFLYSPGDVPALVKHLMRLAADRPLRRALGKTGRARVEKLFSIEAHIEAMELVWQNCLKH